MAEYYIQIPNWVSSHSYGIGGEIIRSYISNERIRYYLLLEDISAKLWNFLCEEPSYSSLLKFAKNLDIIDELDDFILELESLGLIIKSSLKKSPPLTLRSL